jgi:hypothetical protein
MTTLVASTSGFARFEQILASIAAALTQAAGNVSISLAIAPPHLSVRAKRLLNADY